MANERAAHKLVMVRHSVVSLQHEGRRVLFLVCKNVGIEVQELSQISVQADENGRTEIVHGIRTIISLFASGNFLR